MALILSPLLQFLLASFLAAAGSLALSIKPLSEVEVHTHLGTVKGRKEFSDTDNHYPTPSGRPYNAFKGIPFAKPPVGDLRWEEPQPISKWDGVLDATQFRSVCPQIGELPAANVEGSEDCLYLNVYTPYLPGDSQVRRPATLLPVMVYIHGGGFISGSARLYGPSKIMREDVVLVTINYRLGALGFLSTGCHLLPGNYGLLDQILALQWVKSNIMDFCGDPNSVTIFGNSAGAASVHHLMMAPKAKGLFHRAIIQSGNSLCDWAVEIDPLSLAQEIAKHLDCSSSRSSMVNCLRDKSAAEIVRAQQKLSKHWILPIRLTPVVDGGLRDEPVLAEHPRKLLQQGNYTQVPLIIGVNGDEGLFFYYNIHVDNFDRMNDPDFLEFTLINELVEYFMDNSTEIEAVAEAARRRFFGSGTYNLEKFGPILARVLGDIGMYAPHWETLRYLAASSKAPVYSYVFRQRYGNTSTFSHPLIQYMRSRGFDHSLFNYGTSHVDELLYLFDVPGNYGEFSDEDRIVSRALVSFWANFAAFGYPKASSTVRNIGSVWKQIGKDNINFYIISSASASMATDFRKEEADFWLKTVPFIRDLAASATSLHPFYVATWALIGVGGFLLLLVIILATLLSCKRRRRSYPEGVSLASAKPNYFDR